LFGDVVIVAYSTGFANRAVICAPTTPRTASYSAAALRGTGTALYCFSLCIGGLFNQPAVKQESCDDAFSSGYS
jgi:hypothetical protein